MSENCWGCGRPVATSSETAEIEDQLGWYYLEDLKPGQSYTCNAYNGGEKYTLVSIQNDAREEQGTVYNCWMVVRREKTGTVVKKLGIGDSYGDVRWVGSCFPVEVRKVMVESWEVV